LSAEGRQQAVAALVVMIHEWWSGGRRRSADATRGSISLAALWQVTSAGNGQGMRRRTAGSVTTGP
jgi:hypothetical protein